MYTAALDESTPRPGDKRLLSFESASGAVRAASVTLLSLANDARFGARCDGPKLYQSPTRNHEHAAKNLPKTGAVSHLREARRLSRAYRPRVITCRSPKRRRRFIRFPSHPKRPCQGRQNYLWYQHVHEAPGKPCIRSPSDERAPPSTQKHPLQLPP